MFPMKFHNELFFFFSSRRRHTRSLCDWSSDVCSSDLDETMTGSPGVLDNGGQEESTVIYPLKGKAHYEIKEKVDYWHSRLVAQLYRFNTYADFWRLVKPPRSGALDGFANPQVTETTRA